jgi:hypothetical protein
MKFIIKESQHNFLLEQMPEPGDKGFETKKPTKAQQKRSDDYAEEGGIKNEPTNVSISGFYNPKDKHKYLTILQIGTAFIPYVGPFISAGIGLYDAKTYYDEGDKTSAGLTAAFSMLPFAGSIVMKIPGVKELGVKGMAALSSKLISKKALSKAELEIANSIVQWEPKIQKELMKMAPKLTKVSKDLNLYKASYIKKYGQAKYNHLLAEFLYDTIDGTKFIQTLKTASKSSNIRIKPLLGGGADHRVFQSALHPNRVIKVEIRPGEVDKWYNLFKSKPKIFAKTLGKSSVKDTDGSILKAVVMEKLNTAKFGSFWDDMTTGLNKFQSKMGPSGQESLEHLVKSIKKDGFKETKWKKFIPYFKKNYPQLAPKADEFVKMVEELYKITPNPDIRKFNLGYDANDILKALDI